MAIQRCRGRAVRQPASWYADHTGTAALWEGRPDQDRMPRPPLKQLHRRPGTGPESGHLARTLHRDSGGRRAIAQAEERNSAVRGRPQVIRSPVNGREQHRLPVNGEPHQLAAQNTDRLLGGGHHRGDLPGHRGAPGYRPRSQVDGQDRRRPLIDITVEGERGLVTGTTAR